MTVIHEVRVSTHDEVPRAQRVGYGALAVIAWAAIALHLVLSVTDVGASIGAALLDLLVVFSNLTLLLAALVSTALLRPHGELGVVIRVGLLTAMLMGVVTAVVNVALQDPSLPDNAWRYVDLAQHYVVPIGLIVVWLAVGPRLRLGWADLPAALVVPVLWLVVTLVRGAIDGVYPYDYLDAGAHGYLPVLGFAAAIIAAMLGIGTLLMVVDRLLDR